MASYQKVRKWKEDYTEHGYQKNYLWSRQTAVCALQRILFEFNLKPSNLTEHSQNKPGGNTRTGNDLESLNAKRTRNDIK